jgi:hypothetical protein
MEYQSGIHMIKDEVFIVLGTSGKITLVNYLTFTHIQFNQLEICFLEPPVLQRSLNEVGRGRVEN